MSTLTFDGRVAVVTGAGNGLGRSHALELARRGAAVVVNDLGTDPFGGADAKPFADQVVEEIKAAGGRAVANRDSVATRAGGAAIIQSAMDTYGRVDVLIHNAGFLRDNEVGQFTDAELHSVLDVHLMGGFHTAQAAVPHMRKQKYGRIVMTVSPSGLFGNQHQANYAAGKCGLVGLANVLALENAEYGIHVNCLAPNAMTRLAQSVDPATLERLAPVMVKFATAMDPSFVTPLAVYLASEAAPAGNGIYSAVGGRYARIFLGVTRGWYGPRDTPASVEDVAAHIGEIEDRGHYTVPGCLIDEFKYAADGIA